MTNENFGKIYDIVMEDISTRCNVSRQVVEDDFAKFNAEIEMLMETEGLTEGEAIDKVWTYWKLPFEEKADVDIRNVDVDED